MKYYFLIILSLIIYSISFANPTFARGLTDLTPSSKKLPWVLESDVAQSLQGNSIIEASGNVVITHGTDYLKADYARYYVKTNWVYLKGNVEAYLDKDKMIANSAEFDINHGIGWANKARLSVNENNAIIVGKTITKTGNSTYAFTDGSYSTCINNPPDWSIDAKSGKIGLGGYADLNSVKFKIRNTTSLFFPYAVLPLKKNRQSGLLTPSIGTSSEHGYYYIQPYFQVLGQDRDLTLYEQFMSKSGLMHTLEYRSVTGPRSKALWLASFLRDKQDGDSSKYGDLAGAKTDFTNRFWIRGKQNGILWVPEWKFKADIDFVSDLSYLRDFNFVKTGYDDSRGQFLSEFGRSLDNNDDKIRKNTLSVQHISDWSILDVRADISQNLWYYTRSYQASDDKTVQYLPSINFDILRNAYFDNFPVETGMHSALDYMWRRSGASGARTIFSPQISMPLKSKYGTILPQIGITQINYLLNKNGEEKDSTQSRTVLNVQVSGFTEMFRVYDLQNSTGQAVGSRFLSKIQHTFQPRIDYNYMSALTKNQSLFFDNADLLDTVNEVEYSITNRLIGRYDTVVGANETKRMPTYKDFFYFKISQIYDIKESQRDYMLSTYARRPFRDIVTEANIYLTPEFYFVTKMYFSPYIGSVTQHEDGLMLSKPKWGYLYGGIDFQREINEYLRKNQPQTNIARFECGINLYKGLSLNALYRRDIVQDKDLERSLTLRYTSQCYAIGFQYTKGTTDTKLGILVELTGLGGISMRN